MQRHTGARRIAVFGLPIVVLVAVAWGVAVFLERPAASVPRDADLCPAADAIAGRTVFLLDLRKPLGEPGRASLREALRQVSSGLPANAELRVFALSETEAAPRREIDRLCRPYDESTLARDGVPAPAGDACDDLPADLPEREAAVRFCARRDALEQRVDGIAGPPGVVANAFLVEAIEETSLEFADLPGAKSLVVFSDMVQHSPWHSQAEGAASVGFAEFKRLRAQQNARIGPPPPPPQNVDVTIFYVPRIGMTGSPQQRRGHKRFWQEYVADAFQTAPVFNDMLAMPAYQVVASSRQATTELAAAERLQREREEAERLLEEVVRERAALEEAQRTAATRPAPATAQAGLPLQQASEPLEEPEESAPASAASAAESLASSPIAAEPATDPPATGDEPDAVPSPPSADIAELEAGSEPPAVAAATPAEPPATSPDAPPPPLPEDLAGLDAPPSSAPCPVQLKLRFEGVLPEPPRLPSRAAERLATATIAVRYMVDEQGATVDNEVSIVESQSTVNPPAFLPQFSASARELVEEWEFDFMPTADANCTRQQELTVRFRFGG